MNLIKEPWIPVLRSDGNYDVIAPYQIGADANPVIEIAALRPDFQGALYEFLIGLLQTAFAPEDEDEWEEHWQQGLSSEELAQAFDQFTCAFKLSNNSGPGNNAGPVFMQDFALPDETTVEEIRKLLIEFSGSPEFFVKPEMITGLCDRCAATALYTLQTYSPAGGRGYRTGLRGGGPLTTLLTYNRGVEPLWRTLWLNVLPQELVSATPKTCDPQVFPWMGPTRKSTNNEVVNPEDVDRLQAHWAMPRRIRMHPMEQEGVCSLCGATGPIWTQYKTINYGARYSSTWQHPLSPYRVSKAQKDNMRILLSIKGKRGSLSYDNWLALTIGAASRKDEAESVAAPVKCYNITRRSMLQKPEDVKVWCYGYDMANAKAKCWYEHQWPLIKLAPDRFDAFLQAAETLSDAAVAVAELLPKWVSAAWFDKSKSMPFVQTAFYRESETDFLWIVGKLCEMISKEADAKEKISTIFSEWHRILLRWMRTIFDRYALTGPAEQLDMKRVANALDGLERDFYRNKLIKKLKGNP